MRFNLSAPVIAAGFALTLPLLAQEAVTRVPLGRARFYPPDQIHLTTTVGAVGIGVPGVSVSLSRLDGTSQQVVSSATTDQSGSVAFLSLPPGQYLLSVKARNFVDTVLGPIETSVPAPTVALLPTIQVVLNPSAGPIPAKMQDSGTSSSK